MTMHCKNCVYGTEAGLSGQSGALYANSISREDIYLKLSLLARFVEHMGSQEHYSQYENEDFSGMQLLLDGIAREIFPEWNRKSEARTE